MSLRQDAHTIIQNALQSAQPDTAVRNAFANIDLSKHNRVLLLAIGKAAWQMARAALTMLGDRLEQGIVITKYGHGRGDLPRTQVFEAGHPVPDKAGIEASQAALDMVDGLQADDAVLFLVSGGGSALFEQSLVSLEELMDLTGQMLRAGCDIVEMNTIRKRLSRVKGGRFAQACLPATVFAIFLSDIISDPLDMIASGPAAPDTTTCEVALAIARRLDLKLSSQAQAALMEETPKDLPNVHSFITGSVTQLCLSAARTAKELGYEPTILTASLRCEAREAGSFLASIAAYHQDSKKSLAFLCGGETVVHVKGDGKGGRNQEIALSAALALDGLADTCLFSIGSDGTDGPTDAAGGIVDGHTARILRQKGIDLRRTLDDNDAYHALLAVEGLIITGPTGTNVNDLSVLLIKREAVSG